MIEEIKRTRRQEKQASIVKLDCRSVFQMPTYLNQVHVPLISHFPCCHKFCCIYHLAKINGRKPPHSEMFTAVWHGCYHGSFTPAARGRMFQFDACQEFFHRASKTEHCWLIWWKIATEKKTAAKTFHERLKEMQNAEWIFNSFYKNMLWMQTFDE